MIGPARHFCGGALAVPQPIISTCQGQASRIGHVLRQDPQMGSLTAHHLFLPLRPARPLISEFLFMLEWQSSQPQALIYS